MPSALTLFIPLALVRLAAALLCPIADCDETFNYYEPLSYLLNGRGLQTWEYSPEFGLRSYAYIALHAPPALLVRLFTSSRPAQFYAVRCCLGIASALCEVRFVRRVALAAGAPVAWLTWILLMTSAGMFHAAVAFLPSSFAMLLLMCAWSSWMADEYAGAIWAVAASALLGWPFVAFVACGPLALDAIAHLGLLPFVKHALSAAAALLLPSAALDSYLYGRFVLAFLNILLYNSSAASGAGAQLYGVEPWHYYVQNLTLNFNVALPAALLTPLILLAKAAAGTPPADSSSKKKKGGGGEGEGGTLPALRLFLLLSGLYIWLVFFSLIPHKEERFMYPVYPLLCLAAAMSIHAVAQGLAYLLLPATALHAGRTALSSLALALCALLCTLRSAGQVVYFGAPLKLYNDLYRDAPPPPSATLASVCVGNEWYRFASSFFLPDGMEVAFIKDGFDGQLPAHFSAAPPEGTRAIHPHFNGMNREEASRYVPLRSCDYLVDLLPIKGSDDERERRELHRGFTPWRTARFLDAAHSPSWSRALYVPLLSERRNAYAEYAVLKRAA